MTKDTINNIFDDTKKYLEAQQKNLGLKQNIIVF